MYAYLFKSSTEQRSNDKFKLVHTLSERQKKASACKKMKPGYFPLVIENYNAETPALEKKLYAIPEYFTFFRLKSYILEQLKKKSTNKFLEASTLIVTVGNPSYLPSSNETLKSIYEIFKDDDGLLYVSYTFEVAFG